MQLIKNATQIRFWGVRGSIPTPGAETVRMSSEERAHARALHQTNDTNGGRSSVDKSCKTWEGGGTIDGPQPGAINWGYGGAHTRF